MSNVASWITPEFVVGIIIILGSFALKAMNSIDDKMFYSLITLGVGIITGSYIMLNRLKNKNPQLKI